LTGGPAAGSRQERIDGRAIHLRSLLRTLERGVHNRVAGFGRRYISARAAKITNNWLDAALREPVALLGISHESRDQMASTQKGVHYRRPDVPCSTCDEHMHGAKEVF
jgi:hypothetical protein